MASIRKRGNTYEYRISHKVKEKYEYITKGGFQTEAEAKKEAKIVEGELIKNINYNKRNMDLKEYMMEYYENKRKPNVSPTTQKRYERNYKIFCQYFKNKKLKEISNYHYQDFLDDYGQNKSKESVAKIHSQIRAAFKYARANGYIDTDPTFDIKINYSVPPRPRELFFIHEHQFKALLKCITTDINVTNISKHLLLLACASGARFGELIALTFDDYNVFTQEININKSFDYITTFDFKETKTESGNRKVTIDDQTNKLMAKYISYQKLDSRNDTGFLFPSPDFPNQPISHRAVLNCLHNLCDLLNINKIGIHALRHSHASIMLLNGLSVEYISERLGHSSTETTRKYYLHIVEEMKKQSDKNVINLFKEMY